MPPQARCDKNLLQSWIYSIVWMMNAQLFQRTKTSVRGMRGNSAILKQLFHHCLFLSCWLANYYKLETWNFCLLTFICTDPSAYYLPGLCALKWVSKSDKLPKRPGIIIYNDMVKWLEDWRSATWAWINSYTVSRNNKLHPSFLCYRFYAKMDKLCLIIHWSNSWYQYTRDPVIKNL